MADPLSLLGLTAGLISLGLQVSGGIVTYVDAVKGRRDELESVKRQVDSMTEIVKRIDATLSRLAAQHQATVPLPGPATAPAPSAASATTPVTASALAPTMASLKTCLTAFEVEMIALRNELSKLAVFNAPTSDLKSKVLAQAGALKYPFGRGKFLLLRKRLDEINKPLMSALTILGM